MQRSLVLTKELNGLVEDQHKTPVKRLLMEDHPLKAHIHHLQESRDQEITVQDLMINTIIIID